MGARRGRSQLKSPRPFSCFAWRSSGGRAFIGANVESADERCSTFGVGALIADRLDLFRLERRLR